MDRNCEGGSGVWIRRWIGVLVGGAAGVGMLGCAEMRQNYRGEYMTYRGAWFCAKAGCEEQKMQRSSKAHRVGDMTVNHGKVTAGAALVFKPGKTPETFTAKVSDCAGKTGDVPADKIKAPGAHGIAGQADSYAVIVDPKDFPDLTIGKGCKSWTVTTHSTFDKGTSWEAKAGLEQD